MKILYVGPLVFGGTCLQRMKALAALGHEIFPIDTQPLKEGISTAFFNRVMTKIRGPKDQVRANQRILEAGKQYAVDVVWIDKGITISPTTIERIKSENKGVIIVAYSPDDMMNPNNQSADYLGCIPLYDLHVTTKSYNVAELRALGAKDVLMVDNAFCSDVHRPITVPDCEKAVLGGPVGFIGSFEEQREADLVYLASQGIPIRIWGEWKRKRSYPALLKVEGRPLTDVLYARAICSFAVNLCFLRKVNRDLQTTRSVEIPACAGFMIAERTVEHSRLFEEGREAEFFSSRQELQLKVEKSLRNPSDAARIGLAARARCLKDGYSNQSRLKKVCDHILNLRLRGS